jgi:signal transduction histidine kinase
MVTLEIHDSIGASLAALKFGVETALKEMDGSDPQTMATLKNVIPLI